MNRTEFIEAIRERPEVRAALRYTHSELFEMTPDEQEAWWQNLREEGAWDLEE